MKIHKQIAIKNTNQPDALINVCECVATTG